MKYIDPYDKEQEALVPEGTKPGELISLVSDGFKSSLCCGSTEPFQVKLPWLDLPEEVSFKEKDLIQFTGPDGRKRDTFIPSGVEHGQCFTVMIEHDGLVNVSQVLKGGPIRWPKQPPRDPVEEMDWTDAAQFLANLRD